MGKQQQNMTEKKEQNSLLLSTFWNLAEGSESERIASSLKLSKLLKSRQGTNTDAHDEVTYAVKRLVRGLASNRKFARLGFATALSRILRDIECVSVTMILNTIKEELKFERGLSKSEKSNVGLGQILAVMAMIQTDKINECKADELRQVLKILIEMQRKKMALRNLCTHALVQITGQVDGKRFTNSVWPQLSDMLNCGWGACTPDTIVLLMTVLEHHKDLVDKSFLSKHWQCKKLLAEENLNKIATLIIKSTVDHPMVHPLSAELLRFAAARGFLGVVWGQIFSGQLLDVKKDAVGLLYLKMLPVALALATTNDVIKVIISNKTTSCLLRQLSNKKMVLHKATKQVINEFVQLIKSLPKELQICVVMCFLQSSAGVLFDNITHTNTVSSLVRNMSAEAVEDYAAFLMDVITGKQQLGKKESAQETYKFATGQLSHMVSFPAIASRSASQQRILYFFCLHGHFTIIKATKQIEHCSDIPETELTPNVRKNLQDSFKQALSKLSTFQPEKRNKTAYLQLLRGVNKFMQGLLETKFVKPVKPFSKSTREVWNKVLDITNKISSQSETSKKLTENTAFELAFHQMALELFTDTNGATEVLQDLFVCHEKAFETKKKSSKKKQEDEPQWIEVLTELLLSLLSQSSHLMRSVVNTMFSVICPHLTPDAFQLILQTLQSSGNDEGPLDFEDEDEAAEEEMEEGNEESDSEENSDGEESGFSSAESENENKSEADDESYVDEQVRANVKAALGRAAVQSDAESEGDLTDSEMEKLDEVLGAAFKCMRVNKKEGKEKLKQIKSYKMRCLELLDILIQNGTTDVSFLLSMLEPLILLMDESQKGKEQRDLFERAQRVFKNLLKAKYICNSEQTGIPEKIEHFVQLSTKVTGIPMVMHVAHAISLMAKVMFSETDKESSPEQSTAKAKERRTKKLGKILKEYLMDFCQKRNTIVNHMLFHIVFTNMPVLLWPMLDELLQAVVESGMKVFRRTKVCGMIGTAINKQSVADLGEESWNFTANRILVDFTKMVMEVTEDQELKKKFVQEILSVIHKVISLSNYENIKGSVDASLGEKVTYFRSKSKGNKDLKRICNQLKHLLFRLNQNPQDKKQDNRKRKAEKSSSEISGEEDKQTKSKKRKQEPLTKHIDNISNSEPETMDDSILSNSETKMDDDEVLNGNKNGDMQKHKKKKKKNQGGKSKDKGAVSKS